MARVRIVDDGSCRFIVPSYQSQNAHHHISSLHVV